MGEERITILVIDDDPELTLTVGATLEAAGYEVLAANSGEHGLELAYTEHPHLVLLDVMMPGMDGYQVCRELQFGYTKDIPVVFLTAQDGARQHDGGQPLRRLRLHHQAVPHRAPPADGARRAARRVRVLRRDHRTAHPGAASRSRCSARLLDHSQLGILYVTLDGVHALEQTQGFEVVDEMFRIVGRRLHEARGLLIREEDFVSISSLGNAFLVILVAGARPRRSSASDDLELVKVRLERQLFEQLEEDLEASLLAKVDAARRLRAPHAVAQGALQARPDAAPSTRRRAASSGRGTRPATGSRREFERVVGAEQITCVYQPIVKLDDYTVLGYELLARGPLQSELHRPDALFEVARAEARVPELDRLCRMMAARGARHPAAGVPALHQRGADQPLLPPAQRRLRAGVRGRHAGGAALPRR